MNETRRQEHIERGVVAHQAGRFEEALGHYRLALEAVHGDAEALSMSGLSLLYLGQHDRALPLLQRAVEREPTQIGFRVNFAEGLERTRQYERARREVQTVLARQPDNSRAWDLSGDIAARLGDEDAAAEGWIRAFALNLANITPALKVAQLQLSLGRYDLALRILDSALVQAPRHAALFAMKSEVLTASRNWRELQATAAQWLGAHPESAAAWRIAARAAFEQGRHIEAANAFARVLALSTPTAADFATYASLNLHAFDYDAAAIALTAAAGMEPDNADMLASQALLQMYLGRFAEAAAFARRSHRDAHQGRLSQ